MNGLHAGCNGQRALLALSGLIPPDYVIVSALRR